MFCLDKVKSDAVIPQDYSHCITAGGNASYRKEYPDNVYLFITWSNIKFLLSFIFLSPKYRPKSCHGSYLIPENFQQRNIQLIQSIKEFLQSDESKFNKFKTHSGQFRQVSGQEPSCSWNLPLCSVHTVRLSLFGISGWTAQIFFSSVLHRSSFVVLR